jgi:hypothetical protein
VARTFDRRSLESELRRARAFGWERHMREAERGAALSRAILLAVASQETDMNDVVGDGGHGRGLFQIDDRSHAAFLARHGAAGPGGKPPVAAAARYAADLLRWNLDYGARNGVPPAQRLKFALSAYNAGAGGALAGFREGDSDRRTTGGNYGREVLRRHAIFLELLGDGGVRPLLGGSRGQRVTDLKDRLAAWYAEHAPAEWERLRVTPGPVFGAGVDRLVRDFQARVGLGVDGVVVEKTLKALAENRKPQRLRGGRRDRTPV